MIDPSSVPPDPAASTHADGRTAARQDVVIRAEIRDRMSCKRQVEVIDLSATGFRAIADYSLDAGQTIWIKLPGFAGLEAKVAWRRERTIGASFVQPLHPAVFDHIVRACAAAY